ncbi:MAG: hypothetical protein P4L11_04635 [Geothrix sp.]|nr:hypothetical protein [Geothrix sp.]
MSRASCFSVILLIATGLLSQDLPMAAQAKFLKSILSAAGQFGFACSDPVLKPQLEANGVSVSPGFKMAWGGSEAEARALKAEGKLVIVPRLSWLKTGGSIAIVEEDGKPAIYLNTVNVKASGMQLPDVILKMAKKPK